MNTTHHRNEIEAAVSKLFDEHSMSSKDVRTAILKLAAAIQAIIVEIERTRSL